MKTDIQIAQENTMKPISSIAESIGLTNADYELYGNYKAKITLSALKQLQKTTNKGKLILVTAITPTPAGEGKSTVSIALADGMRQNGDKAILALREPSLGPCFGIKGGACGGGYAQIVPMEDINLHFTGDIHAISIATNFIASFIDNHIQQGNELNIDPRTITWKRCVDLNDRALRKVIVGLGGTTEGIPREDGFNIAVASEIMAILCLSNTISDLKEKINSIIIGKTYNKQLVFVKDLNIAGAVATLLKDALRPNLVQTLEKTPAFVHGGPFANIAHGCNSINATNCALALGDYVVTEAGFAADLGAEKFLDIKCRKAGLYPNAIVIVATIRALKMHGGISKTELSTPNTQALLQGFCNLQTHIENMHKYNIPVVVAVNKFITDTYEEIKTLIESCGKLGVKAILCEGWEKGGKGTKELAKEVVAICNLAPQNKLSTPSLNENSYLQSDSCSKTIKAPQTLCGYKPLYNLEMSLEDKITTIATEIYRASSVEFSPLAKKKIAEFSSAGYANLPVCMAKTQNSISHDKTLLGSPKDYIFPIRDVQLFAGAGFIVALSGDIMTMPGLPKKPAACNIDIDDDGVISGLF